MNPVKCSSYIIWCHLPSAAISIVANITIFRYIFRCVILFWVKNHQKTSETNKKDGKQQKKYFDLLSAACSTLKVVKIHNPLKKNMYSLLERCFLKSVVLYSDPAFTQNVQFANPCKLLKELVLSLPNTSNYSKLECSLSCQTYKRLRQIS